MTTHRTMERHISGANEVSSLHMAHPTDHYTNEPEDFKLMETDTIVPSTVDSSTLRQSYTSSFNIPMSTSLHMVSPQNAMSRGGKGIKKMKKSKNDDDDARSQSGDEEVDIDKYVHEDTARISVKILRKIIPKLRIACYFSDEQVSGKRKLKHLWDERPSDWPQSISFKDPNNALKETRKPGKDELTPMYEFLKKKYLEMKSSGQSPPKLRSDMDHHHYQHQPQQHQQQQRQHQQNLHQQQHQSFQTVVKVENLAHNNSSVAAAATTAAPTYFTPHQPSDDGNAPSLRLFSAVPPSSSVAARSTLAADNNWSELAADTSPSQSNHWHQSQPSSSSSNLLAYTTAEEKAVLAPTRSEHGARSMIIHQEQLVAAYATGQDSTAGILLNGGGCRISPPPPAEIPAPVEDIYRRLADKQRQVASIADNSQEVIRLLHGVQAEVIDSLYSKLNSFETRMCLMFLDAAHQYEALLDVIVVLGQMDSDLLANGCQEIINKFNRECTPVLMIPGVVQHRLLMDTSGRLGTLKSIFDSSLEKKLYGIVQGLSGGGGISGDSDMITKPASEAMDDSMKQLLQQFNEQFIPPPQSTTDIKTFGISQRPGQEHRLVDGLNFIEQRLPLTAVSDDEQKQVDDLVKDILMCDSLTDLTKQQPQQQQQPLISSYGTGMPLHEGMAPEQTVTTTAAPYFTLPVSNSNNETIDINLMTSDPDNISDVDGGMATEMEAIRMDYESQNMLDDVFDVISNDSPLGLPSSQPDSLEPSSLGLGTSQITEQLQQQHFQPMVDSSCHPITRPQQSFAASAASYDASCTSLQWSLSSQDMQPAATWPDHVRRPSSVEFSSLTSSSSSQLWPASSTHIVEPQSWPGPDAAAGPQSWEGLQQQHLSFPTDVASGMKSSWSFGGTQSMMHHDLVAAGPFVSSDGSGHNSMAASSWSGYGSSSAVQYGTTAQCVPSATTKNAAPIPSFVSDASFDDFVPDESQLSGRRCRRARGSTSSGGRAGRGIDKNTRRN